MSFLLIASLLSWVLWHVHTRLGTAFLPELARLLDRPEYVQGLGNALAGRAFLKWEFRGRKVVVMRQSGREEYSRNLVVSMETRAPVAMESFTFIDYKSDREGELALFALEAKHQFVLRHEEGCLKARSTSNFDAQKCLSVLEAMHTLACSIERRAGAGSQVRSGVMTSAVADAN